MDCKFRKSLILSLLPDKEKPSVSASNVFQVLPPFPTKLFNTQTTAPTFVVTERNYGNPTLVELGMKEAHDRNDASQVSKQLTSTYYKTVLEDE